MSKKRHYQSSSDYEQPEEDEEARDILNNTIFRPTYKKERARKFMNRKPWEGPYDYQFDPTKRYTRKNYNLPQAELREQPPKDDWEKRRQAYHQRQDEASTDRQLLKKIQQLEDIILNEKLAARMKTLETGINEILQTTQLLNTVLLENASLQETQQPEDDSEDTTKPTDGEEPTSTTHRNINY